MIDKNQIYQPPGELSFGPYCVIDRGLRHTYISHGGKGYPMSLAVVFLAKDAVYVAADKRFSKINENYQQLSYRDDYNKIVPSKAGNFLVVSTGLNQFGHSKKTLTDLVADVDLWAEQNTSASVEDIIAYADKHFQLAVSETYQYLLSLSENRDDIFIEKVCSICMCEVSVARIKDGCPTFQNKAYTPRQKEIHYGTRSSPGCFIVFGPENIRSQLTSFLENAPMFHERDILISLQMIFDYAKERNTFVGGNTDIYKISASDNEICKIL